MKDIFRKTQGGKARMGAYPLQEWTMFPTGRLLFPNSHRISTASVIHLLNLTDTTKKDLPKTASLT